MKMQEAVDLTGVRIDFGKEEQKQSNESVLRLLAGLKGSKSLEQACLLAEQIATNDNILPLLAMVQSLER